jgi:penicillin amidase
LAVSPLNIIYADMKGVIGWQLAGEAPIRRRGWGTIPLPGSDTENGWEGLPVDFENMPYLQNPEEGYVASANNKPTATSNSYPFLGLDWTDGYRITRIAESLERRDDWGIEEIQRLQVDQVSIPWRDLCDVLLSVPPASANAKVALTILNEWDGRISIDSVGASVFEFFLDEMIQHIARVKAPHTADYALGRCFTPLAPNSMFIGRRVGHLVNLIRKQPDGWFKESWYEELDKCLSAAISRLEDRYGTDTCKWAWGRIRKMTLHHPEGDRAFWGPLFNLGPISWGGDINTISQAEYIAGNPTSNPTSFASLRAVYDIGNWEESRFALPGGQSGNPLSPNYYDQFLHWQRGEGIPIAWSKEMIEKLSVSKLVLLADKS